MRFRPPLHAWLMGGGLIILGFDLTLYLPQTVPLRIDPQAMYYTLLSFSVVLFLAGVIEWRIKDILDAMQSVKGTERPNPPATALPSQTPQNAESVSSLEKLKVIISLHQNEVNVHWTRNNYFLLTSSILLVALSQVSNRWEQLLISAVGFLLNLLWLLVQIASNRYVSHWNKTMYALGDKTGFPLFYPQTNRKIAIRKVVIALPFPFLVFWLLSIILIGLEIIHV